MPQPEDTIAVNVVVEMTTASLKAIVENAKRFSGKTKKGLPDDSNTPGREI